MVFAVWGNLKLPVNAVEKSKGSVNRSGENAQPVPLQLRWPEPTTVPPIKKPLTPPI